VALSGLAVATAFSPTRWLLESTIMPKQGEGPSQASQKEGFYDLRFRGLRSNGTETYAKAETFIT
ncbi:MAG: saccharopine dehydrogenase, partial [Phormidesmis sp.]